MNMKRLLLLLFAFTMALNYSFAQDEETTVEYSVGGDTEFGIGINLTTSTAVDEGFGPADGYEYGYSFSVAAQFEYFFSKTWGIKAKAIYDNKVIGTELGSKINLAYITVPVMANWHFGTNKRWYLHFGLYTGLLLSADVDGADAKDLFESSDFGSALGIGYSFPLGSGKRFFIETSGQNSFSSPIKDSTIGEEKLSRSTIGIGLIF